MKQIDHNLNETQRTGDRSKDNTRLLRVHRVSHRIGVVIGLPLLTIGVLIILAAAYLHLTGFTKATNVSDVYSYSFPVTQQGDLVIYRDGSSQSATSYITQENNVRASRHRASINDKLALGLAITVLAAAVYVLFRAIGWIIAGAFQ
ncbi:hypothetical protein [Ochrobactrum sp. S1502_03]|uniref:hypothetical protein n=1 Tax=Ochrobactrum sp. S1502_03 TaxID=3108451 RepID=UPI0037C82921